MRITSVGRLGLCLLLVAGLLSFAGPAVAGVPDDDDDTIAGFLNAIDSKRIKLHLLRLQQIASHNNDTRVAGTAGQDQSAEYVASKLTQRGYAVSFQEFEFNFFEQLSPPALNQVSPDPTAYVTDTDVEIMEFSGSGDVTGPVQAVDIVLPQPAPTTSGCEAADFAGFTPGNIALIQRGTCTFGDKALNAQAAGATGVIIFNQGNSPDRLGLVGGTLGTPVNIPVVFVTFAVGEDLASPAGTVVHVVTDTLSEVRTTRNVIAETPGGDPEHVVVVGAHLDSVAAGPGINDNGSGSAMILEIAIRLASEQIQTDNKVRFIWFSAEEQNLVGSTFYVNSLSPDELARIDYMLNYDMVASPNFVRFVYDGDGSAGLSPAGPPGSEVIEQTFLTFFGDEGLATEPTAFDGRSDYGPFIDAGIPAGGLFTGAEVNKTPAQAAIYGGTAGIPFDPCYHEACDTFDNVNGFVLNQMADAAAFTMLTLAGVAGP
jgi:Zn-dependent M28 family amino/carboxypeptidase